MSSALDDPLGMALESAVTTAAGEAAFLRALAKQSILVILSQPPGPGDAAPQRNLVEWRRADGTLIVPLFTAAARLPGLLPPPAALVRVPFRLLLSVAGARQFVINSLSPVSWAMTDVHLAVVRKAIAAQGLSSDAPSPDSPWAFRAPDDQWFAVAYALATWFVASGRVDLAYLYELHRVNTSDSYDLVLALDEPVDMALVAILTQIAIDAGAPPARFEVRFLPDEPTHRAGIAGLGAGPFYRRPKSR